MQKLRVCSPCAPASILRTNHMNALNFHQAGRIKEPYTFYPYKVNIWSPKPHHWYQVALKVNTFKIASVYSLEIASQVIMDAVFFWDYGYINTTHTQTHRHTNTTHTQTHRHTNTTHTQTHIIVWTAICFDTWLFTKWISTYSNYPSYTAYQHFSISTRTLTEHEHRM